MAAEDLFCKFHQYGHCKFGVTCRKFHTQETCNTFKCTTTDCSYRHPIQCKFFVLYGRCKFGTDCSFLHVATENEIVKNIKNIEKEVFDLKREILTLKTINLDLQSSLNGLKEEIEGIEKAKISETKNKSGPLLRCELCDFECISEEMLKQHHSSVHEVNLDVQQLNFKCDLCDYESKSKKGVKIHRRAKHKCVEPLPTNTSSSSPSPQAPINCILEEDGCPNFLNSYFNKYTAICPSCQDFLKKKQESSPFSPDLCPCCQQNSNGLRYSLCSDCLESIQEDGYAESSWGSWHLDRTAGKIICIGLDFD